MKLLNVPRSKGVRQTASQAGRGALSGANRGARRGAKRGFGIGAMTGGAKGGAQAVRERVRGTELPAEDPKSAAKSATRKARRMAKDTQKTARKQYVRARVAAARATASRRTGTSKKAVAGAGAAGAAGAYFLDPNEGKRRRNVLRDRTLALFRKGSERARREAEYRKSQAEGKVEAAKSMARPEKPAANDQQLTERVKSEIFQPADAPKGSVNVNVENGIVYLRGEADESQAKKLESQARSVDGVKGVESLITPS
jgi:osmotically-inducible protein OsmY